MFNKIIQLHESVIKDELKDLVRNAISKHEKTGSHGSSDAGIGRSINRISKRPK